MHNLIYLSSASHLFSNEELFDILHTSRTNNTRLGVTGLLLYHEGSILQILEGEEDVLASLYKTISKDQRHRSVIKMIDCSISQRNFQDWSMGFKQVSTEDWSTLTGYLNLASKEEFYRTWSSKSAQVVTIINSFVNVNKGMMSQVK